MFYVKNSIIRILKQPAKSSKTIPRCGHKLSLVCVFPGMDFNFLAKKFASKIIIKMLKEFWSFGLPIGEKNGPNHPQLTRKPSGARLRQRASSRQVLSLPIKISSIPGNKPGTGVVQPRSAGPELACASNKQIQRIETANDLKWHPDCSGCHRINFYRWERLRRKAGMSRSLVLMTVG